MSFFEQDPSQNISMTQQFESMTEFLGSDFLPEMTEDMNEQFDSTSEFLMEVDACKMIGEEEKEPENKTNFFNELHLLENNGQKMEESGGVTDSLDQAFSPDVSVYKPQEVEIQTDLSNGIVPFELTGEERHHCSERAEKDVELVSLIDHKVGYRIV